MKTINTKSKKIKSQDEVSSSAEAKKKAIKKSNSKSDSTVIKSGKVKVKKVDSINNNKIGKKPAGKKGSSKFTPHTTSLQVGSKAPFFEGLNQDGKTFSLNDFKGKKLILYFYPKDNTPGCTTQACNLEDNLNLLLKEGYDVVGVSADDVKSHKKFADKFNLRFNLLADVEKKAIKAYDVFGKKMFMGKIFDGIIRTTFIISKNGLIENIITGVEVKDHANQIRNVNK